MIGKLKGIIDSYGEDHIIVDVNGVGYVVHCSARTLQALPPQGDPVALAIETHVREDQIRLFGFQEDIEREWFRLLQTVQGVGTKVALSILSTLKPSELASAISLRDKAMVARSPGVGPKVAERIVTELKDKAPKYAEIDPAVVRLAGAVDDHRAPRPVADAVSAPRVHNQWMPDRVFAEPGFPDDLIKALEARGDAVVVRKLTTSANSILVTPQGFVGAADPRTRGALAVGSRPTAMNSRTDLLDRLRAALADPGVDGVLATSDILDDLVLLGALEDKVVFSSMNRGGLAGAQFELDDRMTAATAAATAAMRMNGGKMLCRIDLDDPGTVATLEACARAIDELASHGMIAMVEPFMSSRVDGKVRNDLSPDAVIKSIHIGQGLGSTSAYTWMKLPVVEEMDRVMEATTLPTLLLGGDPADPDEAFASWEKALGLPSVRGLIVGRTLLYPADDDVSSAVATAVSMVR